MKYEMSFQRWRYDSGNNVHVTSTLQVSQRPTIFTLMWSDWIRAQNKVFSLFKKKNKKFRHGGHLAQQKARQPPSHWQHTQNSGPPASSFCFAKNLAFSACSCCCFCSGGLVVVVVVLLLSTASEAAAMRRD